MSAIWRDDDCCVRGELGNGSNVCGGYNVSCSPIMIVVGTPKGRKHAFETFGVPQCHIDRECSSSGVK